MNKQSGYRILCDMDEVLVDFIAGACALHGVTQEELLERRNGSWSVAPAIREILDERKCVGGVVVGDYNGTFWIPIAKAGVEFWEELQPLPWARDLWYNLNELSDEVFIVTDPSYDRMGEVSVVGKVRWIRKHFGRGFTKIVPTSHKHILAGPRVVLIDDRPESCKKFKKAGGQSILFPAYGNELSCMAKHPVEYVLHQLKILV